MAGQQLKNLERRISRTFQLGINYRCVKFQWSPIKKVLWREVKQNIQWLFKRTRVLTFRRSHLSFKFPNSVSNLPNKILGIVWKCWSYRFNLSPKNKKFLEQNLWQANVHVHCQRKPFFKSQSFQWNRWLCTHVSANRITANCFFKFFNQSRKEFGNGLLHAGSPNHDQKRTN